MAAVDLTHAANLLDGSLGTAAFTASTAPLRCRLMTANGSGTTAGTELASAAGYLAGAGAPTVTFGAASTTNGQSANTTAVTVPNMPAATVVGVELWDSAGTPRRKWFGPLAANKTVAAGDTLTIAVGSLTVTLT